MCGDRFRQTVPCLHPTWGAGRAFRAQMRVLYLSALLCMFFVFAFLALTPELAHATYADVATSYGTVEELSPKTDTVDAADVPEGTYNNIEVRTSSSFCAVSNCTLKKSGDTLLAAFTLSKTTLPSTWEPRTKLQLRPMLRATMILRISSESPSRSVARL